MTTALDKNPFFKEFLLEIAFPWGVRGPVGRLAAGAGA